MRDQHKCSQCGVQVKDDNLQYKQCVQTLDFLFPTVADADEMSASGQTPIYTDQSDYHIVVTTLSGDNAVLVYNPDQTILSLKNFVEQELKTPCDKQSLLYKETELKVFPQLDFPPLLNIIITVPNSQLFFKGFCVNIG